VARAALPEHHGPGSLRVVYPPQYAPGDTDVEQLEFALKHDGVCLAVLAAYFQKRGAAVEPELDPGGCVNTFIRSPFRRHQGGVL